MITFTYLFDGFQRRFSTPSMSKPTRMRPKRRRISDLQLRFNHQHHNRSLPDSHNHRIISSISREISVSIAHESHHDLSRTREFFLSRAVSGFLRYEISIDFATIGGHRLNRYSSSFNPFVESLSIAVRIALCGFQAAFYHSHDYASLFIGTPEIRTIAMALEINAELMKNKYRHVQND